VQAHAATGLWRNTSHRTIAHSRKDASLEHTQLWIAKTDWWVAPAAIQEHASSLVEHSMAGFVLVLKSVGWSTH
jgi:hypothetical protein